MTQALSRLDSMDRGTCRRLLQGHNMPIAQGRIDEQEVIDRCANAMKRKLPSVLECSNSCREWAVIGGGPSINQCVKQIRSLKARGVAIVSVNKSHDWLLEHGIVPDVHVLLDPMPWVADYVKRPRMDVRYFVASQCHDSVFDALEGYPVFLWHAGNDFGGGKEQPNDYLKVHHASRTSSPWIVIPGPTTVGLRVPVLGQHMRKTADKFHMFGMDSSSDFRKLHAYDKGEPRDATKGAGAINYREDLHWFETNSHMSRQVEDFDSILKNLPDSIANSRLTKSFQMVFYGYGMLPFYAATLGLHADPACNAWPPKVQGYVNVTPTMKKQAETQARMAEAWKAQMAAKEAAHAERITRSFEPDPERVTTFTDSDGDIITMNVPEKTHEVRSV